VEIGQKMKEEVKSFGSVVDGTGAGQMET